MKTIGFRFRDTTHQRAKSAKIPPRKFLIQNAVPPNPTKSRHKFFSLQTPARQSDAAASISLYRRPPAAQIFLSPTSSLAVTLKT
jgi:hypothetical protein